MQFDLPGLTARPFAGKSDYPKMATLIQAISLDTGAPFWVTAEDVERDYQHLINSDPATDMLMVEDAHGELVAYCRVAWQVDDEGSQRFSFPLNIHPKIRTAELQRALLRWVEARAKEVARATTHTGRRMLWAHVRDILTDTLYVAALEAEGYGAIRYTNQMIRDLSAPIEVPPLPSGLEVRPVPEAHYRSLLTGMDEAFRDHWGHTPMHEEAFAQWIASPQFKPALWQVAWDGDQIAGGVLNYIDEAANAAHNQKRGWTDPIFVRRPWRKRGLAKALIMRSLVLLKEQGMTEALLDVDTQNLSGAFRLYESCGFKTAVRSTIFEKALNL